MAFERYLYGQNYPIRRDVPSGHCIEGVTTAFCKAMDVQAIMGYGIQGAENRNQRMEWSAAFKSNISGEKIFDGALIGVGVFFAAVMISIGLAADGFIGGAAWIEGDCTNEVVAAEKAIEKSRAVSPNNVTSVQNELIYAKHAINKGPNTA